MHPSSVLITRVARADDDVVTIADRQLGPGYLTGVTTGLRDFTLVAELDGHLVGFVTGLVRTPGEVRALLAVPLPAHLSAASAVGVLKTIAVHPDHVGRGVGTALARECVTEFARRDARVLCSVAWRHGGTINVQGILEHLGLAAFAEVPDYWMAGSIREGFTCPQCGPPPCRCAAVMFG